MHIEEKDKESYDIIDKKINSSLITIIVIMYLVLTKRSKNQPML